MSLDVVLLVTKPTEVYSANITHDLDNLTGKTGAMANAPTHWIPNIEAPNASLSGLPLKEE